MKLATLPLIRNIWTKIRQRRILQSHAEVATFWTPVIRDYFDGRLAKHSFRKLKDIGTDRVIWQYWGQGMDAGQLPEVVQHCFASVDRYKGDYKIIRLSDDTIADYLDLPDFVLEKRNYPAFNRTFFSDLLRLALLHVYGGVWMDATILLTGPIPETFNQQDYFVYQRDEQEQHQKYWESSYAYYWGWQPGFRVRMLSSIFFAKPASQVVTTLLDLILHYWKTQDTVMDYFFFQILYHELIGGELKEQRCMLQSDVIPHCLQTKLNGGCDFISYAEIMKSSNIHKLSYFDEQGMAQLRCFLEEVVENRKKYD